MNSQGAKRSNHRTREGRDALVSEHRTASHGHAKASTRDKFLAIESLNTLPALSPLFDPCGQVCGLGWLRGFHIKSGKGVAAREHPKEQAKRCIEGATEGRDQTTLPGPAAKEFTTLVHARAGRKHGT